MGKSWQHVASKISTHQLNVDLSVTYPAEDVKESVRCVHCGCDMDDYAASMFWDPSFSRLEEAHKPFARRMHRNFGVPREHVNLRGSIEDYSSTLYICCGCGWWLAIERAILPAVQWQFWYITLVSAAALKEFDLSDIGLPVQEVRRYLMRRFDERCSLHPRIFEETVGSVFSDHGYATKVTGYSRDGGIDVVLHGRNGDCIGVQVKRHQRTIQVEQIRAFLGALILGGYTRGIFVSSSGYQRGAKVLAHRCSAQHVPIELIGPEKFYEMLGIAQLSHSPCPTDCGLAKKSPPKFSVHSHVHLNSL